ncbi:MAG: hypothetical protein V7739_11250 [Motiliproteus sp.]
MITKSTITAVLLMGLPAQEWQFQPFLTETATTSLFAMAVLFLCLIITLQKN